MKIVCTLKSRTFSQALTLPKRKLAGVNVN